MLKNLASENEILINKSKHYNFLKERVLSRILEYWRAAVIILLLLLSLSFGGVYDLGDSDEEVDLQVLLENWRSYREFEASGTNSEWYAMNITTWQAENGGWRKGNLDGYATPYDGVGFQDSYFANLSTLADKATTGEIRFLAEQYSISENESNMTIFKNAVERGVDFIVDAQHSSGGWPQVYPAIDCLGCEYHNLMTYNDYVIPSAMLLLWDVSVKMDPFNSDIVDDLNHSQIQLALDKGMDFILKSQIMVDGKPTIWGQQHHPETYESMSGRSWELACRTPNESSFVTAILLNWPDRSPDIVNATWGAVGWYEDNAIENMWFDQNSGTITERDGASMWYRYYNVSQDEYFFTGYDSKKVYDLYDIPEAQRSTYSWAYNWGERIVSETSKIPLEERI